MAARFSPHYGLDGQSPVHESDSVDDIRKNLFAHLNTADEASPFKPALNAKPQSPQSAAGPTFISHGND
jgi:hypothetical protein